MNTQTSNKNCGSRVLFSVFIFFFGVFGFPFSIVGAPFCVAWCSVFVCVFVFVILFGFVVWFAFVVLRIFRFRFMHFPVFLFCGFLCFSFCGFQISLYAFQFLFVVRLIFAAARSPFPFAYIQYTCMSAYIGNKRKGCKTSDPKVGGLSTYKWI